VRNALEAGESPLTEAERDIIAECANSLGANEKAKLQEILISIGVLGGSDHMLTIKAINTCISLLKGEGKQHRKAKEAEADFKEALARQLDYLKVGGTPPPERQRLPALLESRPTGQTASVEMHWAKRHCSWKR
jgi:hypothetical protein